MQRQMLKVDHARREGHTCAFTTTLATVRKLTKGTQDGPVPRASAQISVKVSFHLMRSGRRVALKKSIHVHHPARSTETTLRAIAIGNRCLYGMHTRFDVAQTLCGDNMTPVDGAQTAQAAVDGQRPPRGVHQGHGTAAAAPLSTADVRASQRLRFTQPVEQRDRWRGIPQLNWLSVDPEIHLCPPLHVVAEKGVRRDRTDTRLDDFPFLTYDPEQRNLGCQGFLQLCVTTDRHLVAFIIEESDLVEKRLFEAFLEDGGELGETRGITFRKLRSSDLLA
mmetsp:Transcript_31210/g.83046  ORF Transcript_31210/g.83046 Transcript_31210/m.83046 type:complete len:279 (+) Transcript_31210:1177-2013(+)